jgi:hypothetical protein|tara:strand:- start:168 stop:620 length:453 start_codon:yes stop_codon:yes gene_type:complete
MKTITCFTLFDITNTNVLNRAKPVGDNVDLWKVQRNSQANFDTILQCISLRGTPDILHYPHHMSQNNTQTPENHFGFLIEQEQQKDFWYWKFDFRVQSNSVFTDEVDSLGYLTKDCHEIPMIKCGTECLELPNFLDTTPELNNIYFMENV